MIRVLRLHFIKIKSAQKGIKSPKIIRGFFDRNLGKWENIPFDLELKPGFKPFNYRYYPVPNINKETFHKELQRLVEIGVSTPAQQLQYETPIFIIPKKEGTLRFIMDYQKLYQKIG